MVAVVDAYRHLLSFRSLLNNLACRKAYLQIIPHKLPYELLIPLLNLLEPYPHPILIFTMMDNSTSHINIVVCCRNIQ